MTPNFSLETLTPSSQKKVLKQFLSSDLYPLLKTLAAGMDFSPNDCLHGDALREDIYYKACQREGIQKLFRLIECRAFLLDAEKPSEQAKRKQADEHA